LPGGRPRTQSEYSKRLPRPVPGPEGRGEDPHAGANATDREYNPPHPSMPMKSVAGLALLLGATRAVAAPAPVAARDRPNIVFILADDLGYGDLAATGQPKIATPRLTRMPAKGPRLSKSYPAAPCCAP